MENKIHNFSTFIKLYESDADINIIIGDSTTPIILKNSKSLDVIGNASSERSLWKSGMNVKHLKEAVAKYQVNENVRNVVINIGTNGGFNFKDDIKGLVKEIKRAFPKANLFAVQGSWGWGGNKKVTPITVKKYYDIFRAEGVNVLEPPIGDVADPHINLPVYSQIGSAIDKTLTGGLEDLANTSKKEDPIVKKVQSKEEESIQSNVIVRPGDPYKYKVENDHWLAKRDNHTRWYEITGRDFKPTYQVSIDTLDSENPTARTKNAPKRTKST